MATIPASENEFPEVLFAEGAAPAAPATGLVKAYAKSDGLLYWKDDAGVEYPVSQAADLAAHLADAADAHDASAISIADAGALYTATDVEAALAEVMGAVSGGGIPATILDAKGDLIAASAADTAARVAVGSNGAVLLADSGQSAGLLWNTPTAGKTVLDSGNFTSSSSSFVDVTGATVTITTRARRCLVGVVGAVQVGTAADSIGFDIDIDGNRVGGTNGITGVREQTVSHRKPISFTYLTDVLTAASHTFKLQAKRVSGSGTFTIFADSSDMTLTIWVAEQFHTA